MSETPNRYGANSSEQEQWVLDGKLYSGNPAIQRQVAAQQPDQQPLSFSEPAGEAADEQVSYNCDGGNTFAQPPTLQPPYGQNVSGNGIPNNYSSAQNSYPAGNRFPIPPGYPGNEEWNTLSGMSQATGSGGVGPGSFSGLTNNPVPPYPERKSRVVPVTILVLGIVLMLVLAPIACIGMLVGYGLDVASSAERQSGGSVITREDDYYGHTLVLVEVPEDTRVTCKTTFNGKEIPTETNAGSEISADTAVGDDTNNEVFSYNLRSRGKLVIDCRSAQPDKAPISAITVIPNVTFTLLVWAFILPTVMGFGGLGLLIWGIIWTVKRGRDNQRALVSNSYYR
ncbi:hypothetical protein [Varibaculum vaginae]|uniref:hypothetical protein n=1 Tax=Varibaculum vaginae TaxID=2364797 RepID=UPI000F082AA9|nr:hypothetical protein [Varibaculum vaginae]